MRNDSIVEVGSDVYLVSGSSTNWVIVKDGDTATLVDTGYPKDRERLLASLTAVGVSPAAVAAVLITHAHNDHLGAAEYLRRTHGTPILMHQAEVPHARREFLHQVTIGQVLANGWRPGVLPWAVHALRAGGKEHIPVVEPQPFPAEGRLDLPGRPLPVLTPGHTDGHCAYHLPDAGVLVTGDALVSGHPTSRLRGPQLLPGMFHRDRARALDSLTALDRLDADVVLPGHGPVVHTSVGAAVEHARELAV
ncbi:MBL fold metallo-hydrolase [Streptomyces yaanensis]|uniref:MBL fold metallo-hydrolase n=1 Tax=Streptomyces yaanensis TaxID=1142239 RepID=A0ABV7SBY9_9ACTN|nr:MBL fold metallo-hydrolase [Streptomyces sp. CGMCC 4.7035]WNB99037.1 MBL fold metallo-hydrolase [Streptomyces sp. CGMCC 4.7035]